MIGRLLSSVPLRPNTRCSPGCSVNSTSAVFTTSLSRPVIRMYFTSATGLSSWSSCSAFTCEQNKITRIESNCPASCKATRKSRGPVGGAASTAIASVLHARSTFAFYCTGNSNGNAWAHQTSFPLVKITWIRMKCCNVNQRSMALGAGDSKLTTAKKHRQRGRTHQWSRDKTWEIIYAYLQ